MSRDKLIRGAKRCHAWLQVKKRGDIATVQEVLDATKWQESSLNTYINKNKLADFLSRVGGDQIEVIVDGSTVTERQFYKAFTQKLPDKER